MEFDEDDQFPADESDFDLDDIDYNASAVVDDDIAMEDESEMIAREGFKSK